MKERTQDELERVAREIAHDNHGNVLRKRDEVSRLMVRFDEDEDCDDFCADLDSAGVDVFDYERDYVKGVLTMFFKVQDKPRVK